MTFHRHTITGYFKCNCGYSSKVPDSIGRHARDKPLDHFGDLPSDSHMSPGGVMVAEWPPAEGNPDNGDIVMPDAVQVERVPKAPKSKGIMVPLK